MRPASLFLISALAGVPLGQAAWEVASSREVQALDVLGPVEADRLRAFEDALHDASFLHQRVTPYYNRALYGAFDRGNEKVLPGDDGWLFYAPDLDLHTARVDAVDEAVACVADLRDQLASVDVELVLVPVMPKSVAEFEHLTGSTAVPLPDDAVTARFSEGLRELGLWERVAPQAVDWSYLKHDTHWTPATMAASALSTTAIVRRVLDRDPQPRVTWDRTQSPVSGRGDLVAMLHWPEGDATFLPQVVVTNPVREIIGATADGQPVYGELFEPRRDAEVLLLGDSFTAVFGDPQLHFGGHAGLDAQLAKALGTHLDVIAVPGGGARGVREALARRGDRLAGKSVVVWQFSLRDLVADPERWAPIDVLATRADADLPATPFTVDAELVATTAVPPDFDYRACLAVYTWRVTSGAPGLPVGRELHVLHPVIEEYTPTDVAAWRAGVRARLELDAAEAHVDLEAEAWMSDVEGSPTLLYPTSAVRD